MLLNVPLKVQKSLPPGKKHSFSALSQITYSNWHIYQMTQTSDKIVKNFDISFNSDNLDQLRPHVWTIQTMWTWLLGCSTKLKFWTLNRVNGESKETYWDNVRVECTGKEPPPWQTLSVCLIQGLPLTLLHIRWKQMNKVWNIFRSTIWHNDDNNKSRGEVFQKKLGRRILTWVARFLRISVRKYENRTFGWD